MTAVGERGWPHAARARFGEPHGIDMTSLLSTLSATFTTLCATLKTLCATLTTFSATLST